ncbi:hypothetical protein PF008_g29842 [Phytophthora fragariae]|uniref:Secreted protein n=1 Tax=Phytophthora fragariae TaxID=53985 RepID=A0A6G0Q820_9STRA|nr:hypothetical protein PF008_g29842 [Phytophthora fragariae]
MAFEPYLPFLRRFFTTLSLACSWRMVSSVSCPSPPAGGASSSLPITARTGALDRASATTLLAPGRYTTSKLYSCSCSDHRCSRPARSFDVINHFSAAWSVTSSNFRP